MITKASRLLLLSLSIFILASVSLTAGGTEEEDAQEPVTIQWWGHNARPMVEMINTFIPEFEEENPNITVEYSQKPGGQYIELFRQAYAAGSSPDVNRVGSWVASEYIRDNVLAPMDIDGFYADSVDGVVDKFIPGLLDPFLQDGNLYALPEGANTLLNVVNMDYLREAGYDEIPENEAEWTDALIKMTVTDGDRWVRSGFEWKYGHELWDVQQLLCLLRNEGTTMYNSDGTLALDKEKTMRALTYYYDSIHTHKFANPAFADTFGAISPDVFTRGFAGSTTAGAYVVNGIVNNEVVEDWVATEWVTGPEKTIINWIWAYGISSQSEHVLEASKFVSFLTTKPGMAERRLEIMGNIIGAKGWEDYEYLEENPKVRKWYETIEDSRPFDPFVDYAQTSIVVSNVMQQMSMGGMKPEAAYEQLVNELPRP